MRPLGTAPNWGSYFRVQLWENNQVGDHSYEDSSVAINPAAAGVPAVASDSRDRTALWAHFSQCVEELSNEGCANI